jgi:release factor glutamine methyltransferase
MNASWQRKMPVIESWLADAARQLQEKDISSARLDSEIILAHTIRKPRTYLHAHGDEELEDRRLEIANARLLLRLDRVPVAYIIGHRDFFGRQFNVTSATLIPRPESETMIDLLLQYTSETDHLQLVDIGTGSGCLGITAKLERPNLDVALVDISKHALRVAEQNAEQLKADVTILQGDLLTAYPLAPDIILANLPYIDPSWDVSEETRYEPEQALFASDNGLSLIKKLIQQTILLSSHGYLYIEADLRQHDDIIDFAATYQLDCIKQQGFILVFQKTV